MAEERTPFQAQTDEALRNLASLSAAKRRDAAYFLGEVAYEDAIPTLVDLYQNDKNAGVRRAAGYALGQFRAVEVAMSKGEQAKVTALLRAVESTGKIGRRAPTGSRVRLILSLIVSLAIIGVLYLFQGDIAGAILGGNTERSALLRDVRGLYTRVSDDTRTLQTEYLNVISARPLSCVAFFNAPAPYVLDQRDASAYRDINNIVQNINNVNALVASARVPYDSACATSPESFAAQQANDAYRTLVPALPLLADIELALTAAEANTTPPTAVPPTPMPPTPAPPTPMPPTSAPVEATSAGADSATGAEPTQPLAAATLDTNRVMPPLYNIIDSMIGTRGAATLLVQYWEDVGNTGSTAGCSITTSPEIPDNVVLDAADLAASVELARAVDLLNNGLAAVRDGWVDFRFACNSRQLMAELPSKLATARAAQAAFSAARSLLDAVRDPSSLITPTASA